ncbi:trimethylamine methyltransferase family protein [Ruegeria arenilitoris]|uniref:trimethylamine methyltransferase family protein n=1 Tax=Ruegeria arenilitoris TaxID=1173585 RepID=UPI0034640EF9
MSCITAAQAGATAPETLVGFLAQSLAETQASLVLGNGHVLGSTHIYEAMERDYFYLSHADRNEPRTWQEEGATDARSAARAKTKEVLATHHPACLTSEQDAETRKRFRILIRAHQPICKSQICR